MVKNIKIIEYFTDVETTEEYNGYFCSVEGALTIVILGSFCGLRNVNQIHQWACNKRVRAFLSEHFGIERIPCYYWLTCLLKIIDPKSFNKCFINWVKSLIPAVQAKNLTLSLDGKTVCSTAKMEKHKNPLHIVSAQIAQFGITLGQQAVDGKSNEIPAVRELLELLDISGCMIVADAMHCQKETAEKIVNGKADYLLSVKDNQPTLKEDIEDYVQDSALRKGMNKSVKTEKNRDRIEKRTAFVTSDIDWIESKSEWKNIACIGAINTVFETKNGTSNEWYYFISSRDLTAKELLEHARMEWSVETMHWLLDVHFGEDSCRVQDQNVLENLNMARKIALNNIKLYKVKKEIKRPISKIMFDCLLECEMIIQVMGFEN
jgi:predicted transposase YbfD/YdcC